jgi:non-canonical poly(A) RNA polymerase PAPD5/7
VFKGSKVFAFGSYGQDIYLPTSDMDLVLLSPEFQRTGYLGFNKRTLFRISGELQRQRITLQQDVTVISKAKVPIIKFVDILTGLNCDLSLDNDSGLKALTTFDKWRRTWPFLPQLLAVLKQWLLMRDINEVFNGGLGGFSITCMLVSMLQRMAPGQTTNLDGGANLGELLLDFFNLYGNKFNMDRTGISLIPSEYFPKVNQDNCGRSLLTPGQ